ncbi:unnamed protein product [Bursaphelenchus okinawaensis]|uniref:Uncharacterized protein n=1 Tax=Bursaphelenchus okinawaensis TaxID=465554 RepID=A0A811KT62_9BILA|nr:unnamed protein product [Bursaphelenchus okinawaensis]CAG9112858.1 unnamed protein product [Bursaphelenchus okinawaensis]
MTEDPTRKKSSEQNVNLEDPTAEEKKEEVDSEAHNAESEKDKTQEEGDKEVTVGEDKNTVVKEENEDTNRSQYDKNITQQSLNPFENDTAKTLEKGTKMVAVDLKRAKFELEDDDESYLESSENEDKNVEYERSKLDKFMNLICCRGDLAEKKLTERPVTVKQLFKYGTRLDNVLVVCGMVMAFLCGFCQPFFAIIAGMLANALLLLDVSDAEFQRQGARAVFAFLIVGCFLVIVAFIQFCCFNVACIRIVRRIRIEYLKSILRQNAGWFELNHSGALNTKLNDNIERICEGIGDKFGLLIRTAVQYSAGMIVALVWSWQMALPLSLISPIIAMAMSLSSKKIGDASKVEMAIYSKAGQVAEEAITAVKTVSAFNGQDQEVDRYSDELEKGVAAGLKKGNHAGFLGGFLTMITITFMGVAVLYGTFLYQIGVVETPGDIFVVLTAILSGAYHLGNASPHLMVMLTARVSAATIYKTIERTPEIDSYSVKGRKLFDLKGKIVFKNVAFRYPSRKDVKVLKSLSFTVQPGQTVALVGHSGSGKSTVVGILNRLYEYESGYVTIDGHDVRDLNLKWLRQTVGTVQQEPIIFNATVEENLKIGNPDLTEKAMVQACQLANAHEFIENLPDGYLTRIGDGGVQLSGGQKQRIAIARTMARDPKILLLDEATSALDAQSEAIVQEALNNASKGRTTIVIAHRLSTVKDADRIIVLDKGRFIEAGTHNELLERRGAYAKLVRAQQIDMIPEAEDSEEYDDDSTKTVVGVDLEKLRESVRRSFKRDFMESSHLGDAETEELEMEIEKEGIFQFSMSQLFQEARFLWKTLAMAIACCVFNALAMPINALLYGLAFALFDDGDRANKLLPAFWFFLMFVALGVVSMFSTWFTTYMFGKVGEKLTKHLRVRAFENILYQDSTYFDDPQHTPGKLITRLATDAPNVKAAMDTRLGRVVLGVLSMFSAIIIAMFLNFRLTIVCSVMFVLLGTFQFVIARKVHQERLKAAQNDEAGRFAIEAIENVRTIQLLTGETETYKKFGKLSEHQRKTEILITPWNAMNFASTHGLQHFNLAFCYTCGFAFVLAGWTEKVEVFQVVQTLYFGSLAVLQASEFFPEFVKSRLSAALMFNIINRRPKTGDIDQGEKVKIVGDVTLDDVYFAYPNTPKSIVLRGAYIKASAGQTVALVGPSGSGKSTVISMLERFYDPLAGVIKIDGKDLRSLSLRNVRQQVALVEQQPRLFSGSIKDNICYGLDQSLVRVDEILEAARIANADSFISQLPDGYDTLVGEKGTQLSGGQKQRIAIARAIIRKPKILLLDEATSALDSASEVAVQEALDRARLGRTCVTIAHRLSSIQNSDLIVFLEAGKIREAGSHAQLMQQKGKYYGLIKRQDLSVQ